MHQNFHICSRRDKYQNKIKEYWVDIHTSGSFDDGQEEQLTDRTHAEGTAESFHIGLAPHDGNLRIPGEEPQEPTDDELDEDDGQSVKTGGKVPKQNEVEREYAFEARNCES